MFFAWMGTPPDQLSAEEESELPPELQTDAVHDFDPGELRNEKGEWTSGSITLPLGEGSNGPFNVMINPTERAVRSLAKDAPYHSVRVLIGRDHSIYVWAASDATHSHVQQTLDLDVEDYDEWSLEKGKLVDRWDKFPEAFAQAKTAGHKLIDFDPSELRDPTGKWTTGGGAVEGFASPNVASGVNFEQATKALTSEPQRQLTEISSYIDDKLGINGSNTNVVGAWADGAENSLMMVAPGASPDAMRVAMAMKGYLANQKSVLMFQPHEDGNHMMISFPVTGSLADIHAGLLQNKVWFHTLEPTDHGATVHVFASDQATVNAVGKAAGKAPVEFVRGHGEFIPEETISKRRASEERAVARRGYEKVIADADRSHALAGQDVGKIWQDVRDRWQSISATKVPVV